jgi:hypothetical protein
MTRLTLFQRFRDFLAGIFFSLFLLCSGLTVDEYRRALYEDYVQHDIK